ncbi:MAG: D-alanine--D-alanine ligase [Candidatus Scalindua sp.]
MAEEKNIAVLMGGISPERKISLQSGKAIANALAKTGNHVIKIVVNDDMVNELDNYKIDVAFVALHGYFGEDGGIQEVLESKDILYTGSGVSASRLTMDKVKSKDVFKKNNIPTPDYFAVSTAQSMSEIIKSVKNLKLPVVTKPVSSGSSIGISIIREYDELQDAIKRTGPHCTEVLFEKYIEGRELTVSILDDKTLPVIEIKTATGFYDYDAKYKSKNTEYIILESAKESSGYALSHAVYDSVQELAIRAHNNLGCRTFSKVDMILGNDGEIYILKVNTIPGFTERSLLPKAAAVANISFTEICSIIVDAAFKHAFSSEQTIQADIQDKQAARISI